MTGESYIEELEHALEMVPGAWDWVYMAESGWTDVLTEIVDELARLEPGLAAMKKECLRLEVDGMWPAVPSFNWEGRENDGYEEKRYLRLEFPAGTPGFEGNRCRLYIGCKKGKVAEAHKKADNRRQWEELDEEITRLERFLQMTRSDLQRVAGSVKRYKLPEGLPLLVACELGTDPAARGAPVVPKEEWVLTGSPEVEYNLGVEIEEGSDGG